MKDILMCKAYVCELLEEYRNDLRRIAQLRYELEHPVRVSSEELIAAMALGHKEGEAPSAAGHISDKTLYIALNYQEEVKRMNDEVTESIATKLFPLEQKVNRLRHYVGLLDERQGTIIRRHYFEGCTLEQLGAELQISPKTLRKLKNTAIDMLAEMYEYSGIAG